MVVVGRLDQKLPGPIFLTQSSPDPIQRLAAILSANTTATSFKTEEKLRACFKNPLILLLSRLFFEGDPAGFLKKHFHPLSTFAYKVKKETTQFTLIACSFSLGLMQNLRGSTDPL